MKIPFALAEKLVNRYLQLDPAIVARFATLAGKVMLIEETYFAQSLYVLFQDQGCQFRSDYVGTVDVTLRGPLFALMKLASSDLATGQSLFSAEITCTGDIKLAQKIAHLMQAVDVDWEEQLAQLTGDIIAHQLGNGWRTFTQWRQEAKRSWQQNLTEYLQEEIHYVPSRAEITDFIQEVDQVRAGVERLEARLLAAGCFRKQETR